MAKKKKRPIRDAEERELLESRRYEKNIAATPIAATVKAAISVLKTAAAG